MNPKVTPPLPLVEEQKRENRNSKELCKTIGLRVQDFVSARVSFPCVKEGVLLAAAADSTRKMVINNWAAKSGESVKWKSERKKRPFEGGIRVPSSYFPIGLRRCETYHWVNSLMQFFLYIPSFREIFSYVPKSLQSFNQFADLYFQDLQANKTLSRADGLWVAEALLGKFPHLMRVRDRVMNLDEAIQCIWKSAASSSWQRPDWQILWDSELPFETLVTKEKEHFFEWLVTLQRIYDSEARENPQLLFGGGYLRRQYLFKEPCICLELDAFLEIRPDEEGQVIYFTYLKTKEGWVQCADEKITLLYRTRSFEMAMQRGILFHYRYVPVGRCSVQPKA